jgi:hypothetical protein
MELFSKRKIHRIGPRSVDRVYGSGLQGLCVFIKRAPLTSQSAAQICPTELVCEDLILAVGSWMDDRGWL